MQEDGCVRVSKIRRELLAAGATLPVLVWADGACAQAAEKIHSIGLLSNAAPSFRFPAFRQSLRKFGWIEGKNIVIEARYADGKPERLPELAAELVRLKVDLIFARFSAAARAARQATSRIPIVMTYFGDPVAAGLVDTFARPGGNVTGLSSNDLELVGKKMELLKEIVPRISRVAVLWSPPVNAKPYWDRIQLSAKQLGVALHSMDVANVEEFDKAFSEAVKARAGALFIIDTPLIRQHLKQIAGLAKMYHLPSIHSSSEFTEAGGLVVYGANSSAMESRVTVFVDKILKGERAGDLPVEHPTQYFLDINLKSARTLGITIPLPMLVRADRVIGE